MNVLVTGGAGFIGSHLADALIARGDVVTILDNISTGRLRNVPDRAKLVKGSVLDPATVYRLVSDVEVVVHLAAAVGVRQIVENPLGSFITNIRGTEIVFEAADRYRVKLFLASSSEIYGKTKSESSSEDDDRITGSLRLARWGYATSKAADETLAFAYHRERGVPMVIGRLFNTSGPRQTGAYGMVIPTFVRQALAGEPLTVFGDGRQTRCFCHVKDVVRAILGLIDSNRVEGDVFNIGTMEEVSMKDLADLIIDLTGSTSQVASISYDDAFGEGFEDMARRVPNTQKIKDVIGWEPELSLRDILHDVVGYQKHLSSTPSARPLLA